MDKETIERINSKCPYDQGVFFQPNGIPDGIMEHVIISSYESSGMEGGSCWGDEPQYFSRNQPTEHMRVLDIVLEEIAPNISYLHYKKISTLINNSEKTHWEYYGNYTESVVEYIVVSELEKLLEEISQSK